jgi:hypothetical protein
MFKQLGSYNLSTKKPPKAGKVDIGSTSNGSRRKLERHRREERIWVSISRQMHLPLMPLFTRESGSPHTRSPGAHDMTKWE